MLLSKHLNSPKSNAESKTIAKPKSRSVPLMHHDPDRSLITDPDPDHSKGMHLNGTSLLTVTCTYKNQVGWSFWCPYRNVDFFNYTYNQAQGSQLRKPLVKISLAFSVCNYLSQIKHDCLSTQVLVAIIL